LIVQSYRILYCGKTIRFVSIKYLIRHGKLQCVIFQHAYVLSRDAVNTSLGSLSKLQSHTPPACSLKGWISFWAHCCIHIQFAALKLQNCHQMTRVTVCRQFC